MSQKPSLDPKKEATKYLYLIGKIGTMVLLCILIGFAIGLGIEKRFPSNGIWLIIGTLSGVAGGFYQTYKEIIRSWTNEEKEK